MMRKKLEWLKRGACLVLAGTLVLCSENVSYAAMTTSVQAGNAGFIRDIGPE